LTLVGTKTTMWTMNPQVNLRLATTVHDRLERVGRALDAQAPVGTDPTGKTGAAKRALLTGLADLEAQLGLEASKSKRGAK
jgi:hypothetical protein